MAEEEKIGSGYYVVIPMKILLDEDLTPKARLLFGVIANLSNQRGYCFASNIYMAELTGWHKDTISEFVAQLISKEYVIRVDEVNKTGLERRLFIPGGSSAKSPRGVRRNGLDGIGGVTYQNNISLNNKENSITIDSKESIPNNVFNDSRPEQKNTERKKKENKKKKEVDPCYSGFVKVWTEAYPQLGFDAVSGNKIKLLIAKTKQRMALTGKDHSDPEKVAAAFAYVIAYVKRSNHFCHLKPITTFESQYLSIIAEIESGKRITTTKPNARDVINSYRQGNPNR